MTVVWNKLKITACSIVDLKTNETALAGVDFINISFYFSQISVSLEGSLFTVTGGETIMPYFSL